MSVLGLIPARGGSKGIPGKNLANVAGKSLLVRAIETARATGRIDRVVVSTEHPAIAAAARGAGADVLDRPAELTADETPMLDVVLHAVQNLGGFEAVCLLQ